MNYDKYSEVVNGKETYKRIAKDLLEKGMCLIGWTDGAYDHRDILFTYNGSLKHYGKLQGGRGKCRLWVSIAGFSCNAFLIKDGNNVDNTKNNSYIAEKLMLHENSCNMEICGLINDVIKEIDEMRGGFE